MFFFFNTLFLRPLNNTCDGSKRSIKHIRRMYNFLLCVYNLFFEISEYIIHVGETKIENINFSDHPFVLSSTVSYFSSKNIKQRSSR